MFPEQFKCIFKNWLIERILIQLCAKHWPTKHWPVFGFFSKFLKNFIYWKNIGKTKWTRRQNRWFLIIGIVTTELVHSFYNVHELFLPRYFNLERLLGLKFFDFGFFEPIVDKLRSYKLIIYLEVFKLICICGFWFDKIIYWFENLPNRFFENPQMFLENFSVLCPTPYHGCEMFTVR